MKTHGAATYATAALVFLVPAVLASLLPGALPSSGKTIAASFWDAANEASAEEIDHAAWQQILNGYLQVHVSGINRFDYAALKANSRDRAKLEGYLDYMQRLDPRDYSKAEQKAYWINLYNSLTVKLVVDAYPVKSIRDVCADRASGSQCPGPWKEARAKVAGRNLSLDNIENDILRPVWKDNLVHYGLSCASYGCPSLLKTAFTAENTKTLLTAAAREYVNHPRGASFIKDDLIIVSSIYQWYSGDFGEGERDVIRHLQSYADEELAKRLENFKGTIDYDYDWSLNRP